MPPATLAAKQSFMYLFTVALLCLYSGPVIVAVQLGRDIDAAFWIGRFGLLALLVPGFIVFMHLVNLPFMVHARASRAAFIITAVVPAILLSTIGGVYMSHADYWRSELISEDCTGYDMKPTLQKAYLEALDMYHECEKRLIAENGGTPPFFKPTLQACQEWARMAPNGGEEVEHWKPYSVKASHLSVDWSHEFKYLASVEATHTCGGFCTPGPMLWSDYDIVGRQGSRCAPLVGTKLRVVQHEGQMLLVVSLIGIAVFFGLYGAMAERLKPFFMED